MKLPNLLIAFLLLCSTSISFAGTTQPTHPTVHTGHHTDSHDAHQGNIIDTAQEIQAYSKHHLQDSHDFTLFTDHASGTHVGFSLPMFVWTSKGPAFFMSSAFKHNDDGHVIVEKSGVSLAKIHSKIYELNPGANRVEFDAHHHPTNAHKVLDLSITKNVFGMLLTGILMLVLFGGLAKGYKKGNTIPKGIGRALEPLVLFVRDEIARPNIGEEKYRKYMGYLLTVFFFIWILNLLGLTPLGFNVTGNIAVTACLAIFTFIITQIGGTKDYWKHIFWMPGVPVPMKFIMAPIEFIGMFTKPFALMLRLFANITAGHSVVMALIGLAILLKAQFGMVGATGLSLVLTLFITLIELLVAFLQAYIFTMLSSLFIGMAVEEHDDHH